jgi:ABC-type Fe3+/spermidine/putrescine transport system ATPase subunit
VADFLGHANFIEGHFTGAENGTLLFTSDAGEQFRSSVATGAAEGYPVKAFIRPELVTFRQEGDGRYGGNRLTGTVVNVVFSGSLVSITVGIGNGRHISVERQSGDAKSRIEIGSNVDVVLPEDALQLLPV